MKKRIILTLTIALVSMFTITSCKKYEEGPGLSLRSKTARLAEDWVIEKYIYNGEDRTEEAKALFGADFSFTIKDGGTYTINGDFSDEGKWELIESKEVLQLTPKDGEIIKYTILKLKNEELWLRYTDDGDVEDVHYMPK